MLKANEALKKLNVIMYRHKIGNNDYQRSTRNFEGAPSLKRYSVNSKANGVLFSEISPNILNARSVRNKAFQQNDYNQSSQMNLQEGDTLERMNPLEQFLGENESEASLGQKTGPS